MALFAAIWWLSFSNPSDYPFFPPLICGSTFIVSWVSICTHGSVSELSILFHWSNEMFLFQSVSITCPGTGGSLPKKIATSNERNTGIRVKNFVHWPTLYANLSPMNLSFLICKVDKIFSCHDRMRYIPTQGLMQQVVHKCELLQLVLLHPNMCPSNFKIPHFDNVTSSIWRLLKVDRKGTFPPSVSQLPHLYNRWCH